MVPFHRPSPVSSWSPQPAAVTQKELEYKLRLHITMFCAQIFVVYNQTKVLCDWTYFSGCKFNFGASAKSSAQLVGNGCGRLQVLTSWAFCVWMRCELKMPSHKPPVPNLSPEPVAEGREADFRPASLAIMSHARQRDDEDDDYRNRITDWVRHADPEQLFVSLPNSSSSVLPEGVSSAKSPLPR